MKKLISLLLVLTLALSLVGGLGISAMASDEAPEAAQEETTESTTPPEGGEQGEDPAEPTEGETTEPEEGEDESGEITEPTEGEEIAAEPSAAGTKSYSASFSKDITTVTGNVTLAVGDTATINLSVEQGSTKFKLASNSDGAVASSTPSGSDTAETSGAVTVTALATGTTAIVYTYKPGGGALQGLTFTLTINVTVNETGEGAGDGEGFTAGGGSGSTGEGGGDQPSGSGTSVSYEGTNTLAPGANVSFVVNGFTFGVDRGSLYIGAATVADGKLTVATSNFLTFGEDGSLFTEDPPGEYAYLYIAEGALQVTSKGGSNPGGTWALDAGGHLSYNDGETTWYITGASASAITAGTDAAAAAAVAAYTGTDAPSKGGPGGGGGSETADAEAPVIVTYPKAVPYVKEGTGYAAPTYSIQAKLAEGVASRSIYFQWFVGDVAVSEKTKVSVEGLQDGIASSTVTIDALRGMPTGVYQVTCQVSCNTEGGTVSHTTTAMVTFAVCKGILENSFLTFSDVHQTFKNVGMAIYDTMIANDGYIPALIICTGDWVNGAHYTGGGVGSENYNATLPFIQQLQAQSAGIDIVYVSGNHENGSAAADATIEADLGAAADYDGVGVIYNSYYESDSVGSSAANDGLFVIGINFEEIMTGNSGDGHNYNAIIDRLRASLEEVKAQYQEGDLVVISAHAGLHDLGKVNGGTSASTPEDYNVDNATEIVKLLNEYADGGMRIMYLFGHDHSKGESEFFLDIGDTITSVKTYDSSGNHETEDIVLKFGYGHAGYITNNIGGQQKYTVVTWTDEEINRVMNTVEQLTAPAVSSSAGGSGSGSNSGSSTNKTAPKTGDDANIVLWASLFFLCGGAAVVVATRKKEHN